MSTGHLEFIKGAVHQTQQEVIKGVQELVEQKGIKEKILDEAKEYAQQVADKIRNPQGDEPQDFPPMSLESETERTEYGLVMDYLESIGLKFAPSVLRYESQHPNQFVDRFDLAKQLHLRAFDRTPLLVQMIEEKRKALGKQD
jgi:hypothetical protein